MEEQLFAALRGFLAEPHGCAFCDSGKLRNPLKPHDPTCPYAIAAALLEVPSTPRPAPTQPAWTRELESREWSQVLHSQAYVRNHIGAGAPGHGQFLLIAKLAKMLDTLSEAAHD